MNEQDDRVVHRLQTQAVTGYLKALHDGTPKDNPDKLLEKIERLDEVIGQARQNGDWMKVLTRTQQKSDTEKALRAVKDGMSFEEVERRFIEAVAPFSERKGITYTTWREVGVPARVLRDAGMELTIRATTRTYGDYPCGQCDFVAASPQGRSAHMRRHVES